MKKWNIVNVNVNNVNVVKAVLDICNMILPYLDTYDKKQYGLLIVIIIM